MFAAHLLADAGGAGGVTATVGSVDYQNGTATILIANNSEKIVVAFCIEVPRPGSNRPPERTTTIQTAPGRKIGPRGTLTYPWNLAGGPVPTPAIIAVVFDDGASAGDPRVLSTITAEYQRQLKFVRLVIDTFEASRGKYATSWEALLDTVRSLRSLAESPGQDPVQRSISSRLRSEADGLNASIEKRYVEDWNAAEYIESRLKERRAQLKFIEKIVFPQSPGLADQ